MLAIVVEQLLPERGPPVRQLVEHVLPSRARQRDPLFGTPVVGECRPLLDLRVHLRDLAREARLALDARLDSGLAGLPLHLGLPLADVGGALQRLKVRFAAGLDRQLRTAEIERLLAR